MERFNRSTRRHHRERMVAKRTRENANACYRAVNEQEWRYMDARVRARTGRLCSCYICANPRSKYGNSLAALSIPEWRVANWRKELE